MSSVIRLPAGETIWIYKIKSRGSAYKRLELLAARSWEYDKLLKDYNTAEPKPQQVRILLGQLGEKQTETNMNILRIAEPKRDDLTEE